MFLSVMGLYQYDSRIFDKLELPDGYDRDAVIQQILLDNADLGLVYPDADVMRSAIQLWSRASQWRWKKRLKITQLDYNPIHNTDRDFTRTESGTDTEDGTNTGKEGITDNQTQTASASGSSDTTNWVNGYNDGQTDSTGNNAGSQSNSTTTAETTRDTTTSSTSKVDNSHNWTITEHTEGNIGVTSTQAMMREEWDIAALNIYQAISDEFRRRFCIMVY